MLNHGGVPTDIVEDPRENAMFSYYSHKTNVILRMKV